MSPRRFTRQIRGTKTKTTDDWLDEEFSKISYYGHVLPILSHRSAAVSFSHTDDILCKTTIFIMPKGERHDDGIVLEKVQFYFLKSEAAKIRSIHSMTNNTSSYRVQPTVTGTRSDQHTRPAPFAIEKYSKLIEI